MTREKSTKELHMEELGTKRDTLIHKVIGNLYKGKINNLFWNNKGQLMVGEEYIKMPAGIVTKTYYHQPELSNTRELLLKNIHSIANVFKDKCPEHLNILEFLLNKIDEGWTHKTEKEIEEDIKEIKERCSSILMILAIEAGN